MNSQKHEHSPARDVSWSLLLAVAAVILGCLWLLSPNVLYTEGEGMQALFMGFIIIVAGCVLIGFHRRTTALWCVTVFGGYLLIWQVYQNRKWAVIHEDIVAIVRFAEEWRSKTGSYPSSLDGYTFKTPKVKAHIYSFGPGDETNELQIRYFMNGPEITYWYSSKSGFGYYPD